MSSSGQGSSFGGDGWNDGGEGSSSRGKTKNEGGSNNAAQTDDKRVHPHSSGLANALRVIRTGIQRLMTERSQMEDVMKGIGLAELDLDKEIARVSRMKEIGQQAADFQMGKSPEGVLQAVNAAVEGEPTPGSSTATASAHPGGAGSLPLTDLQTTTDNYLFGMALDSEEDSSVFDSGAVDYFKQVIEGLGINVDTISEELLEEVMQNFREGSGDEEEEEDQ